MNQYWRGANAAQLFKCSSAIQLIHRNAEPTIFGEEGTFSHGRVSMTVNMGSIDRLARFAIGLVLIAYAIPLGFAPTGWNWVGWIGVIPLATAMFGVCPLYSAIGVSTCPMKRA